MPGRPTRTGSLQLLGALVAIAAVVGTVALGWRWGGGDPLATSIGVVAAVIAVGWSLYSRLDLQ